MKSYITFSEFLKDHNLYWVGSRASDTEHFDRFLTGVVSLYGINRADTRLKHYSYEEFANARIDNNEISAEANDYFRSVIHQIVTEDPSAMFMFYNPGWVQDIGGLDDYADHFICVNSLDLTSVYNSKFAFYEKFSSQIGMLPAEILPSAKCGFESLSEEIGDSQFGYIVQAEHSSGGTLTAVIDSETDMNRLTLPDTRYLVTKYYKYSTSVNVHVVIYNDEIVFFPGSVQVIRRENNHLLYKGADYIAYGMIDSVLRSKFEEQVRILCGIMQKDGYRGVLGVDGIIYNDTVAVVEVNPRFQGSTAALNEELAAHSKKTLQEYNWEAFFSLRFADDLSDFSAKISTYNYSFTYPQEHAELIFERAAKEPHVIRIDTDGYNSNHRISDDVYMFRLFFDTNICFNNFGEEVWIHENVCEPSAFVYSRVLKGDLLALKITLMTIGVRISEKANDFLIKNGGIREGNNNSIDLSVKDIVINAPVDVKFIAFAPYEIRLGENNRLVLYYYSHFISDVTVWSVDPFMSKKTKSGHFYEDIAYLSTDRLRVYMTNKCIYKKHNLSCKFCNINTEGSGNLIPLEDITEVVTDYLTRPEVRHFLVGGQSADEEACRTRVVDIIKMIRSKTEKDIYVMTLPFSEDTVLKMKNAGMTELACNIEINDNELAQRFMPGKGFISRDYYYKILGYAASLYPSQNDVIRSAFIVGLEPHRSFLDGIKRLLENGIQPILSIFRPLPDTDLEDFISPPCKYLYDLFIECEKLCRSYHSYLGPSCLNCQNNTLSLPFEMADALLRE